MKISNHKETTEHRESLISNKLQIITSAQSFSLRALLSCYLCVLCGRF